LHLFQYHGDVLVAGVAFFFPGVPTFMRQRAGPNFFAENYTLAPL
jgi:hypothetical protein